MRKQASYLNNIQWIYIYMFLYIRQEGKTQDRLFVMLVILGAIRKCHFIKNKQQ